MKGGMDGWMDGRTDGGRMLWMVLLGRHTAAPTTGLRALLLLHGEDDLPYCHYTRMSGENDRDLEDDCSGGRWRGDKRS